MKLKDILECIAVDSDVIFFDVDTRTKGHIYKYKHLEFNDPRFIEALEKFVIKDSVMAVPFHFYEDCDDPDRHAVYVQISNDEALTRVR